MEDNNKAHRKNKGISRSEIPALQIQSEREIAMVDNQIEEKLLEVLKSDLDSQSEVKQRTEGNSEIEDQVNPILQGAD